MLRTDTLFTSSYMCNDKGIPIRGYVPWRTSSFAWNPPIRFNFVPTLATVYTSPHCKYINREITNDNWLKIRLSARFYRLANACFTRQLARAVIRLRRMEFARGKQIYRFENKTQTQTEVKIYAYFKRRSKLRSLHRRVINI